MSFTFNGKTYEEKDINEGINADNYIADIKRLEAFHASKQHKHIKLNVSPTTGKLTGFRFTRSISVKGDGTTVSIAATYLSECIEKAAVFDSVFNPLSKPERKRFVAWFKENRRKIKNNEITLNDFFTSTGHLLTRGTHLIISYADTDKAAVDAVNIFKAVGKMPSIIEVK